MLKAIPISDTHLTSCPNLALGELLTYLWGKIGYMGWGVMSRGNMTLARRCNAETHYMVVSTTHLTSCPNFSITHQLLTYLWWNRCTGVHELGVMSKGNMTLAPRCNAKTYSMFVSATHLMFYPNFNITGELLTYFGGKIGTQGYMSLGVMSKGNMTLPPTSNVKTYSMFVSATNLMFCPNYSITHQLLTYIWGEIGTQGYMSLGATSRGHLSRGNM